MKRLAIVLVLIAICTCASVFAAGVDLTGVGTRSYGLGNNYRGVSNTWEGIFWNPAGMVFSKGLKAGLSMEFITPTSGYTSAPFAGNQFSGMSATEVKNEPKTFLMPSFGIYYSNEKVAYGIGFWAPFGLGAKWDLINTTVYNSAYPEFDLEDDLKVMVVQPTFAYKVSSKFSVGIGVKLVYADIMIRKPSFTPNPVVYNAAYAPLKAALGAAAKTPYDHILTEATLDGNGMGFGLNVGLQYKLAESLTLGASVKWYNTVSLDGTLQADTYYPKGPATVKPTLDQLLSLNAITQAQYQMLMAVYSGAKTTAIAKTDVKADLPLPMNIGVGLAYTGIKNLLVTADVSMTQWSSWDVIKIEDTKGKKINELVENWEDGIRMGLGMEYNLGFARLRGGFYTEPPAAVAETMQPTIPDVGRRKSVVGGFDIPLGPFRWYAYYERMFVESLDVTEWITTADKTGYENWAGSYTMKVDNFMLGIDLRF